MSVIKDLTSQNNSVIRVTNDTINSPKSFCLSIVASHYMMYTKILFITNLKNSGLFNYLFYSIILNLFCTTEQNKFTYQAD